MKKGGRADGQFLFQNNSIPTTLTVCDELLPTSKPSWAPRSSIISKRNGCAEATVCVCVAHCVTVCVFWEKNSRGSKMTNWQESEKGFWQSEHEPKEILHPLILWERSCAEHKLPMVLVFFLQEMRIKSFQLLTLYLSTIGSLTGPSLDLVKFGKLSRWAINGKPLLEKEISKTKVNSKGFYCSQHLVERLLHTNQCTKKTNNTTENRTNLCSLISLWLMSSVKQNVKETPHTPASFIINAGKI